jgi:hypothetical protein
MRGDFGSGFQPSGCFGGGGTQACSTPADKERPPGTPVRPGLGWGAPLALGSGGNPDPSTISGRRGEGYPAVPPGLKPLFQAGAGQWAKAHF